MASELQDESAADPIAAVLMGFGRRRAALDYAFFKFNLPERGIALLVDFIARPRQRLAQMRATLYTPEGAQHHTADFPFSALHREKSGGVTLADSWLGATGSRGAVGPIAWDLAFDSATSLVDPQVLGGVRPFDLRLRSVPDLQFSGSVSVARRGFSFAREPGMVGAYFGRRLPDHWYWVSANAFDQPGVSVECMLLDSTIFGLPFLRARVGYFHLRTPTSSVMVMHPLTGRVKLTGERTDFRVVARPHGGQPIVVHCSAPETRFRHLGDRVFTTLLGTCEVEGLGLADGTAGLERREWPRGALLSPAAAEEVSGKRERAR